MCYLMALFVPRMANLLGLCVRCDQLLRWRVLGVARMGGSAERERLVEATSVY